MLLILLSLLNSEVSLAQNSKPDTTEVWNEWYTYSLAGAPQGYYQEKVERRSKDKQIAISQNWVEKGAGITESFIGSVASDDGKFSPVAFFSEKSSVKKKTKLDGRVIGKNIQLTFRAGENSPPIKKAVPLKSNMILSNFVGMMLSQKDPSKAIQFTAIVEDPQDGKFDTRSGAAQILGINKQIKGHNCRKVEMTFDQIPSEWWITKEGKICEVNIPSGQAKLQISSEEEAKKFIKQ